MSTAQPNAPLPNWLFRGYQTALVVIVLIYALILVIFAPSGMFISIGTTIRWIGYLFFIYLAPGTFFLALAVFLAMNGKKPGPFVVIASFLAALWTIAVGLFFWVIFTGYNVVLT